MAARFDPEELIQRARSGDTSALGQLLEGYAGYLSLLARVQIGRRLRRKVDSQDMVQETFLEAHRNFALFQGTTEAELVGWLRAILAARLAKLVRRYLGTSCRSLRLERDLAGELDRSSRLLDQGLLGRQSSPSKQASRREEAVVLAAALDKLPPDYRDVLVLRHMDGLRFPEVAQRLGRTLDSVKNLWVRALTRLRGLLGESP
jgi:RNA polymerase sigma-70 factor (ECF subfamily)